MADPASWDILDEDFEDITDWTQYDLYNGVSSESPDGQLRLYTGVEKLGNRAGRYRRGLSLGQDLTVECKLKMDCLLTDVSSAFFLNVGLSTANALWVYVSYSTATRAVCAVRKFGSPNETQSESVIKTNGDAVFTWLRILVSFSTLTCTVYMSEDGVAYTTLLDAVECEYSSTVSGQVILSLSGWHASDQECHLDWLKIASGLYVPPVLVEQALATDVGALLAIGRRLCILGRGL
jgi:hypothetical protein